MPIDPLMNCTLMNTYIYDVHPGTIYWPNQPTSTCNAERFIFGNSKLMSVISCRGFPSAVYYHAMAGNAVALVLLQNKNTIDKLWRLLAEPFWSRPSRSHLDMVKHSDVFDTEVANAICFYLHSFCSFGGAGWLGGQRRTLNRVSTGSNPLRCSFNVWAIQFSPRCPSSLSCINEHLATASGGNV